MPQKKTVYLKMNFDNGFVEKVNYNNGSRFNKKSHFFNEDKPIVVHLIAGVMDIDNLNVFHFKNGEEAAKKFGDQSLISVIGKYNVFDKDEELFHENGWFSVPKLTFHQLQFDLEFQTIVDPPLDYE